MSSVSAAAHDIWRMTAERFLPESGLAEWALFGHSFGGLVAILVALTHPVGLTRLVVQAPLLEVGFRVPRWKTAAVAALGRCWPTLSLPMHLDAGRLSHDPLIAPAYRADPLVHNTMSARAYRAIRQARDEAFKRVSAFAKEEKVDMRTAALMLGVKRVADAQRLRGLYP